MSRPLAAIAIFCICGAGLLTYWAVPLFRPLTPPVAQQSALSVYAGESLTVLLRRLHSEGWQLPQQQLQIYARLYGLDREIRAGDYSLEDCCETAIGLLELLTSGQQKTYRITLVEGWDFSRVHQVLAAQSKMRHSISADLAQAANQLGMGYDSVEGLFYPDTYDYASGETDVDLLKRARLRQRRLIDELWRNRIADLPYETPYEVVVLASIVEREARLRSEAPRIAGVYVQRLRKGMRLEADPTVIYGLGNDYSRRLTLADLRTDTPWNTYMHAGLPPTPIGIPGEAALRAALAPQEGGMLYFVAKGDGSHIFAPTLAEHRSNVRRVRAARNKQRQTDG